MPCSRSYLKSASARGSSSASRRRSISWGRWQVPLVFTVVFLKTGAADLAAYQTGYTLLFAGVVLVIAAVLAAWRIVSRFDLVDASAIEAQPEDRPVSIFGLYLSFTFFASAGLVAFSIIGFHLKTKGVVADSAITAFYAAAMAVDAVAALAIGRLYDVFKTRSGRKTAGLRTLFVIPLCSLCIPFLALSTDAAAAAAGLVLYGIVLGTHETIMRSAIADLTVFRKRGTAYGVFNVVYGLGFLAGSSVMGLLYDAAGPAGVAVCVIVLEAAALVLFVKLNARAKAL